MAKKKTNEELLQDLAKLGQDLGAANQTLLDEQEAARKAQQEANEEQYKEAQRAAKVKEQSVAEQLLKVRQDALDAQKEGAAEEKLDNKRTAYAGLTEMLTGLTNLIGVGAGASNQKPTTYSKDWMAKADENRKARKLRSENLKERRAELQAQYNDLQAANITSLADLRAKHSAEDVKAQSAISANKAKAAASQYDINSTLLDAQMRQNNDDRDYQMTQRKYADSRQDALNTDTMQVILPNADGSYNAYELPVGNIGQIVMQYGSPAQQARWASTQDNSIRAAIAQEIAATNAEASRMLKGGSVTSGGSATSAGSGFDMSKLGL